MVSGFLSARKKLEPGFKKNYLLIKGGHAKLGKLVDESVAEIAAMDALVRSSVFRFVAENIEEGGEKFVKIALVIEKIFIIICRGDCCILIF